MSEEFKPCPFCGGNRIIKRRNGAGWYTGCNDCNMGFSVLEEPERRWNTRPIEDALRAENERLRQVLGKAEWMFIGHREYEGAARYRNTCFYECPWCGKPQQNGHAPDCPRQLALKPPE